MTQRRRDREIKAQAALDKARDVSVHGGKKGAAGFRDAMKDLDNGST